MLIQRVLDSISSSNTETTLNWLKHAGYALLVIGSERPLSSSDLALVEKVRTICPKIFILISKFDLVKKDDQNELFNYVQDSILQLGYEDELPIFGYSLFIDHESYRNSILQRILDPIQEQYQDVILSVTKHKTLSYAMDCRDYTMIIVQNFRKFRNEERLVREIVTEINKNKEHYKKELSFSTTAFKNEVRDWLEKIYLPYEQVIFRSMQILFNADFGNQKGSFYNTTVWFSSWINNHLMLEFQNADQNSMLLINQFLKEKAGFYSLFLKSFKESFKRYIKELYDVDITDSSFEVASVPITIL